MSPPAAIFESRNLHALPCRLLTPPAVAGTNRTLPLVLFLHGAGERGDDNEAQLKHVVRLFAEPETRRRFPCHVLAPQCPADQKWVNTPWDGLSHRLPESPSTPMQSALAALDTLVAERPIDPRRLYVMGLSMGGYGTWDALMRRPDQFAAGIPICGGADDANAPRIRDVPVWAFHGDKDDAVPVARSRGIITAIQQAGGRPRYTEYTGVGHDSWTPATREPDLLPWLFAQSRQP